MQRVFISVLATVGVGCVAASGDESFILRQNLATTSDAVSCAFIADLNAASLTRGQIALDSPTPYLFHPLFESRIVAAEGKDSLRTVFLKGANVELVIGPIDEIDDAGTVTTDPTTETIRFRSLFSAPLPPNGGLVTAEYDLVPLSALDSIRQRTNPNNRIHAQITATTTAFGDYYGDQIESAPFQFPVTVCNDCITNILTEVDPTVMPQTDPPTTRAVQCPTAIQNEPRLGNACNAFQDGVVDCCLDGTALVCPATVTSAAN